MSKLDWKVLSTAELFRCFADILDELKERKIVRTRNNPAADYAEWLVSQKFNLRLEPNSNRGFDATDQNGASYQIKCRRLDKTNKSTRLCVIRNLEAADFDVLVGVLFNKDFTAKGAYKIPRCVIEKYGTFNKHQNGHILNLQGAILTAPEVDDITEALNF